MDNLETEAPAEAIEEKIEERIIVVKVGTTTLTRGKSQIDTLVVADLARQIVALQEGSVNAKPYQVILVSSAAIAMGRQKLGRHKFSLTGPGESMLTKQMLAAIGQPQLMQLYQQLFASHHDVLTAQALLAYPDFATHQQRENARNTLLGLLRQGIVPIINENDVVATEEIKFGDNDRLSALVAELVGADLLVILTDIEGLYTTNPRLDPQATLVTEVARIDDRILAMAGGSISGQGTGGMISKVLAAQLAVRAGVCTVLVNGSQPDALLRVAAGEEMGTRFLAHSDRPSPAH